MGLPCSAGCVGLWTRSSSLRLTSKTPWCRGTPGSHHSRNGWMTTRKKNGLAWSEEKLIEEPPPSLPPLSRPITELDLRSAGISSVVWCSGFRYDFAWVKLPILNDAGEPLHQRGVTQCPGLYFLGLRRTYAVSSALLAGVGNDAAFIAEHISTRQ